MGKTISYKNLTGGLNVENTIGTINQSHRRTESPDMENIEYYGLGGIKTMEGNIEIGKGLDPENPTQASDSKIIGGWDYINGSNHYMVIVDGNKKVKLYNKATESFDDIHEFQTITSRVSFVNMNQGVVITNGVDELLFYEYGRKKILTGSVSVTLGSNVVTGTSTLFITELNVGDYIEINDVDGKYKVEEITSDTSIKLNESLSDTLTNKDIFLSDKSEIDARLTNEDDPNIDEPIRGLAINYYQGRLFIGTDNGLFYSELGKYNSFDIKYGGGVIRNLYNDTSPIVAIGLYSSYMIIHTELGSYTLDGKSSEPEYWELNPYSNITCKSQQSFTVSNRTYFVFDNSNLGIYPLTMQTIYGDKYIGEVVSDKINDMFTNIKTWETDKVFVVRASKRRQVIFYMPFSGENSSNIGIIYDLHTKTWLKRKVPQDVTIAFEYDDDVYIGTADGKILKEFYSQTFDGEPIIAYWKSPWFDFGDTGHYKSFKEMAIYLSSDFTSNFKIRVRKDINEEFKERKVDSSIYDSDALVWDDGIEDNGNLTYWGESVSDITKDRYVVINDDVYLFNDDDSITIDDEDYFLPAVIHTDQGTINVPDKYISNNTGNEWSKTGIVVKRFPVEKQFFYNYQLELYTESNQDKQQGFCIYGFDIRDIKYEETPF